MKSVGKQVKFGDVVKLNKERITDPAAVGIERYVGIEHIKPEDLRIRGWGLVADGTTFTNYFQSGQVLFVKRRAYQRKVAVADFSGVCSGDIYVLEPKDPQVLLPELLPFICQTESFFEHAVGTSAGSLSPRTNWKQLAKYELTLPPLEEQSQYADALLKSSRIVYEAKSALVACEQLLRRYILDYYSFADKRFEKARTDQIGEVLMGRQKAPKYRKGISPRPFLKVANIGELELKLNQVEEMDFSDKELSKYGLRYGDILLTEGDLVSQYNVGRPAIFENQIDDCCFQNTLIRFRPKPQLLPYCALLLMEGARLSGHLAMVAKTTTVTHLGAGRFSTTKIPVPPMPSQEKAVSVFRQLLDARSSFRKRISESEMLHQTLLNEVLA